jgi:predicted enzyme related to lactoylglutathione lyase
LVASRGRRRPAGSTWAIAAIPSRGWSSSRFPSRRQERGRIHLDVTVDDVDEAVELATSLGGRTTGERHDYDEGVVVVMADPEGHEFCLVQYY